MNKIRLTLIILFAATGFAKNQPVAAQGNTGIKITTLNTEWLSCTAYGPADEELQINNIAAVIRAMDSDIIALQEVGTSGAYATIDTIVRRLGSEWGGNIIPWSNSNCSQNQGIIYKKSTVQFVNSELIRNGGSYSNWSSGRYPALYNVNILAGNDVIPVSIVNIH
ncbi:MAG: hypothetical protein LBS07_03465, partial [Prevotellaceae bacterium]|nr:hypothetical protein [Prevotellaceae bacterium]